MPGWVSSYAAWNNVANKMFGSIKAGVSVYSHYKEDMFQYELDTSTECDLSDQDYIGAPGVESSHEELIPFTDVELPNTGKNMQLWEVRELEKKTLINK